MPLSEHEQRLLDEMERNLYSSEADVVTSPPSGSLKPNYRGILIGSMLLVLGIAALIVGVVIKQPVVGVLGFLVMAAGVIVAMRPARSSSVPGSTSATSAPRAPRAQRSLSDSLQRRWDKRRNS